MMCTRRRQQVDIPASYIPPSAWADPLQKTECPSLGVTKSDEGLVKLGRIEMRGENQRVKEEEVGSRVNAEKGKDKKERRI